MNEEENIYTHIELIRHHFFKLHSNWIVWKVHCINWLHLLLGTWVRNCWCAAQDPVEISVRTWLIAIWANIKLYKLFSTSSHCQRPSSNPTRYIDTCEHKMWRDGILMHSFVLKEALFPSSWWSSRAASVERPDSDFIARWSSIAIACLGSLDKDWIVSLLYILQWWCDEILYDLHLFSKIA